MSATLVGEKKRVLRAAVMSRRTSLTNTDSDNWSRSIQGKVLQFQPYLHSSSVALYSPIQNEVGTEEIRDHALGAGKQVFYPKVAEESSVELVQIDSTASFAIGRFGILEPNGKKRLSDLDSGQLIIIVPGVVFDAQGNRLGRGLGWYDRLLKRIGKNTTFLGLAYEFQIVSAVPVEFWDQKVDYVITERRVIDCAYIRSQSSLAS
jgi:5-formyltetrahydrofolate cyclo-ligase